MNPETTQRLHLSIRGAVQGVGFRPFVYRLAKELDLLGWVINSSQGVIVEVEGTETKLEQFLSRVRTEKPSHAYIQSFESSFLDPVGFELFEIKVSDGKGEKTVLVLPDLATCPECLKEILDPKNRRYLYPFTNCTNCGPRFSIIHSLPYDRPNTSMRGFTMCKLCKEEYENPDDRRFHAQPNACSECGPVLRCWNSDGDEVALGHEAMLTAVNELKLGKIVAVKGLGGFHLVVDAGNTEAVNQLRRRKRRNEKPLALMFQSLEQVRKVCELTTPEERLISSTESPIVLVERKAENPLLKISDSVAPRNPTLGVMLPYTPLHHILLSIVDFPIVATSGNISDEPICIDEHEALIRLKDIADFFLVHNRPIVRHVDDSVARIILGREMIIRRSRGYAPLPVALKSEYLPILAVGAHQKNTIALSIKENAILSQHIGDLETHESSEAFLDSIDSLQELYDCQPESVICDMHPDYLSTKYALKQTIPVKYVQHHFAHIGSCMAENQVDPPLLGVAWDGTGYGLDGTVWGGEFIKVTENTFERLLGFRSFRLPGGSQAIKEPRRAALGILFEIFGVDLFEKTDLKVLNAFQPAELKIIRKMLISDFNSPVTSSAGRLFDAVAAIIGLQQMVSFEGQAAMEMEFAASEILSQEIYPFEIEGQVDWQPMIGEILTDLDKKENSSFISLKFHNTMAEIILAVAKLMGEEKVVLSGGCFQNKYLSERSIRKLQDNGFRPYWHQRVPPNDGGIALGQLFVARHMAN